MNVIPLIGLILTICLSKLSRKKKVSLTVLVMCIVVIFSSLQNITTIQGFIDDNPAIIFWAVMAIGFFICCSIVLDLLRTAESTQDLNS